MDKIDRMILRLLRLRSPLVTSPNGLAFRIGLLATNSESGEGRHYSQRVALLDQASIGLPLTVYVQLRTNQHNDAWVERFRTVTENIGGVLEVYRMSGDLDYLIKAVSKTWRIRRAL